ncbi:MAG: hypothetical protein GY913_18045 [Proteobacteria bacterium]|nr:hypothetical protein [Pseudomonadota bacterium]
MLLLTLGCTLITQSQYDDRMAAEPADSGDCASEDVETWYRDADADGWGVDTDTVEACDEPAGYTAQVGDCDDNTGGIFPGANEICNGLSDDCDAEIDENAIDAQLYGADHDNDNYHDPISETWACDDPGGDFIFVGGQLPDCDDENPETYPGAPEVCDGEDNDCDGDIDDDPVDGNTYYNDDDGDGFGDIDSPVVACASDGVLTTDSLDCDDNNAQVNPDEEEVCDDGLDNDCDGTGCRLSGPFSVSTAVMRVFGDGPEHGLGKVMENAGDLDGDGTDELFVGAPRDGVDDGAAYLLYGPITSEDNVDEVASVTIHGENGSFFGVDLVRTGDLMGKGVPVLLASEPGAVGSDGAVFVFASDELDADMDAGDAIKLKGRHSGQAGYSFDAGDLDGDGTPDLAIGSPTETGDRAADGVLRILNGPITADQDLSSDGLTGPSAAGGAGSSVSVGDVTGDGLADVLVGAPRAQVSAFGSGAAYLIEGPGTGAGELDDHYVFEGEGAGDLAGTSVFALNDATGDGYGDIAVSAPNAETVYVLFGPINDSVDLDDGDMFLIGDGTIDDFGEHLGAFGDLDGDGVDDIGVGVPTAATGAGVVYGFYGPLSGVLDNSDADWRAIGGNAGDGLHQVGPAMIYGEASGFALGAANAGGGGLGSGVIYLFEHPSY